MYGSKNITNMNLLTLQSFVSRFLQMTYNDFDAMQLAVKEYHATVDSNAIHL